LYFLKFFIQSMKSVTIDFIYFKKNFYSMKYATKIESFSITNSQLNAKK